MTNDYTWGEGADGKIAAYGVVGWQATTEMQLCLLRLGFDGADIEGNPARGAANYLLTRQQCLEIADGLRQMAERLSPDQDA